MCTIIAEILPCEWCYGIMSLFRGVSSVYTSCLNHFTEILSCKSRCKQCVYILLESLHRYITLQIKLCTIIAEILSCECCSKLFSRWWNDFYVSWKVKVKSNHYRPWNDFTLTFWRNEKSKSSCENNFVVHTSCLKTSQSITLWMVLVCYVTVSRCKQCVCMLYTSCIHTSQRYVTVSRCMHVVYILHTYFTEIFIQRMLLKIFFTVMKWFLCFPKSQSENEMDRWWSDFTLTFGEMKK